MSTSNVQHFAGELIGTSLLVFFGCGSVAVTVLFGAHVGLLQVAIIWGLGVTMAIYSTRHLSCAHLNPAVSLAMVVGGRMSAGKLLVYCPAQFMGAFFAALLLCAIFSSSIMQYETAHGIVRGAQESIKTAMIFGEFYPNPGATGAVVTTMGACAAEAVGTCILVFLIFSLTEGCNVGRPDDNMAPFFIGLTVTLIICIIAPLTHAGLNPARDLSPRLFAWLAGWGDAAFPDKHFGFLTVYVLSPCIGASAAAMLFTRVLQPLMNKTDMPSKYNCC
jgi:glycerol uptake facilitator protein